MEIYLGREVLKVIKFKEKGTFQAYYEATGYLYDNGYGCGSTCVSMPVGFVKGKWEFPQKWYNMSNEERNQVDGVMIGDTREGPVELVFFNLPEIHTIRTEGLKKLE
jgi:hypothetical protein